MLPQVCRHRSVCLKIHEIRVPQAGIATEAQTQRKELVIRHVVAELSEQRRARLRSSRYMELTAIAAREGAHLGPEPCVPTPYLPLQLRPHVEPHLSPEPCRRRAPTTLVPRRTLVELKIQRRSAPDIGVAPRRELAEVLSGVEGQERDGCTRGLLGAFHAKNW